MSQKDGNYQATSKAEKQLLKTHTNSPTCGNGLVASDTVLTHTHTHTHTHTTKDEVRRTKTTPLGH